MSSCKELRAKGRAALGNKMFSGKWMLALLACFIISKIQDAGMAWFVIPGLIVAGPLAVGISKYFLNLHRNEKASIGDIFYGFTHKFGRNFGMNLYYLFLLTCIISGVYSVIYLMTISVFLIPLMLVLLVFYTLAIMAYGMRITILNFVMADHPELKGFEARAFALNLLRGYTKKSIRLCLSFIGWSLLASLTFGIGNLWLTPYLNSTYAAFYQELKQVKGIDVEEEQASLEEETQKASV